MKQPTEIVRLTWLDSCSEHNWCRELGSLEESLNHVTVGFLVAETDRAITISASYGCRLDDGTVSVESPMCVPKSAILKIERSKPPKWLHV